MQTIEHKCGPLHGRRPNGSYLCWNCHKPYSGIEVITDGMQFVDLYSHFKEIPQVKLNKSNVVYFFNKGYLYKYIWMDGTLNIVHFMDLIRAPSAIAETHIIRYSLFMLHRAQLRWRKRRFEARSLYLQNRFNLSSHLANYLTKFIGPRLQL